MLEYEKDDYNSVGTSPLRASPNLSGLTFEAQDLTSIFIFFKDMRIGTKMQIRHNLSA